MIHSVARTARKTHRCSRCSGSIQRGQRYLRHAASPNGELGNTSWWHLAECASCAALCGRPIEGAGQ